MGWEGVESVDVPAEERFEYDGEVEFDSCLSRYIPQETRYTHDYDQVRGMLLRDTAVAVTED